MSYSYRQIGPIGIINQLTPGDGLHCRGLSSQKMIFNSDPATIFDGICHRHHIARFIQITVSMGTWAGFCAILNIFSGTSPVP